jgi:hypothetical protein
MKKINLASDNIFGNICILWFGGISLASLCVAVSEKRLSSDIMVGIVAPWLIVAEIIRQTKERKRLMKTPSDCPDKQIMFDFDDGGDAARESARLGKMPLMYDFVAGRHFDIKEQLAYFAYIEEQSAKKNKIKNKIIKIKNKISAAALQHGR